MIARHEAWRRAAALALLSALASGLGGWAWGRQRSAAEVEQLAAASRAQDGACLAARWACSAPAPRHRGPLDLALPVRPAPLPCPVAHTPRVVYLSTVPRRPL